MGGRNYFMKVAFFIVIINSIIHAKHQFPLKKIWNIKEEVKWLKDIVMTEPNRYFNVNATVRFERSICCPIVQINQYSNQSYNSECFKEIEIQMSDWFPFGMWSLDPSKSKHLQCLESSDTYICNLTMQYQWYAPKVVEINFGFLCDDLNHNPDLSLKNTYAEFTLFKASNMTKCQPLIKSNSYPHCENFYNYVSFPNMFGHLSQAEADPILQSLAKLANPNDEICHQHAAYILCQMLLPQCPDPEKPLNGQKTYMVDHLVTICQEMCKEASKACRVDQFPFTSLPMLNCLYYDSKNYSDICVYKRVKCDTIPEVTHGYKVDIKDTYYAGDSVHYVCDKYYDTGDHKKVSCDYSGTFSKAPKCVSIIWIIILPVSLSVLLVVTVLITLLLCPRRRKKVHLLPVSKRKRPYDAFVSYYSEGNDQGYVRNTLHFKLEQEADPPFKLLFHERDFKADTLIITNIKNAIQNSNAAIIMMSQEYVDAEWCREEFERCMVEVINDPLYKLFVIMMQPHDTLENCTDYMDKYFRDKTYLSKDDPKLYEKLVEALRELQSPEELIEQETPV